MRPEPGKQFSRLMLVFGILRGCIFLVLGVSLFISPAFLQVPQGARQAIAAIIIAYGIFRIWRVIQKEREKSFLEE